MNCVQKLNGLNLPLIVKGSGEPLIMLHGFLSSKEAFSRQIEYFSNYFTVVAYDLCGFGKNTPMPHPYCLDDYFNEFLKVANCFEKRVRVIGHSFGTRVLLYAMTKCDKIERAVLCGVAGTKPKFKLKRELKRCVYKIVRPFCKRGWLESTFFSSDYNALCEVQKQSFKKIVSYYLDEKLGQINAPILAVFGSEDSETPPKSVGGVLKRNIKDCTVVEIKNSGHFCFVQRAAEFNIIAKEFLV